MVSESRVSADLVYRPFRVFQMSVCTDSPSKFVRNGTIKPRLSQVYVEIPTSPFVARLHQNRKENASPKVSTALSALSSPKMSSLKRKNEEPNDSSSNKSKQMKTATTNRSETDAPCHHCRKRKPLTDILQCTRLIKGGSRCRTSYCDICLHERYSLHLDAFKNQSSVGSEQRHASEDYIFSCPRCDGRCTCAPCRKKGIIDISKPQHKVDINDACMLKGDAGSSTPVNDTGKGKPPRKKSITPEPFWIRLPTLRSRKDVEDRLYIHEFVLRFNPILNIGVKNLEELDDPMSLHDSSSKAILLALLDIVAVEEEVNVKDIQLKLKSIQGLGLNWSKIIPMVEDLRSLVPETHPFHTLPAIEKSSSYKIRGNRFHGIEADNLLPMLLHLVNIVCNGGSVREELEMGNEQIKKARINYHAALKNESDRWNDLKQSLMATKPNIENRKELKAHKWTIQYQEAETKYKEKVNDLKNYFRLESNSCVPRFEPLGIDADGRIYYLPSSLGPFRGKKDRLPSPNERLGFRKWSWFIAVHGKPGTQIRDIELNEIDYDSSNEDEFREEGWWGFAEVSEIRKLSKWLASRAEVENAEVTTAGGTSPETVDTKALAKHIAEFADFIDWRLKRSTSK